MPLSKIQMYLLVSNPCENLVLPDTDQFMCNIVEKGIGNSINTSILVVLYILVWNVAPKLSLSCRGHLCWEEQA